MPPENRRTQVHIFQVLSPHQIIQRHRLIVVKAASHNEQKVRDVLYVQDQVGMFHVTTHLCSTDKEAMKKGILYQVCVSCAGVLPDIGSLAMQRTLGRGMTINCCKVSCGGGG